MVVTEAVPGLWECLIQEEEDTLAPPCLSDMKHVQEPRLTSYSLRVFTEITQDTRSA